MNKITAITVATSLGTAPTANAIEGVENCTGEVNEKSSQKKLNEGIEALSSLIGTVTANSLNVRSTPDTSKTSIGKLTKGETVDIISQEDNGWYKINFNGKVGYVSNLYIKVEESIKPDYSINVLDKIGEVTGVASTASLSVRNTPSEDGEILYTLKNGANVNITGETSNGWYRITDDKNVGFVSAKHIKEIKAISQGKVVNVALDDTLNVRESASASSKILYTLKNETSVNILEKLSNGWMKISYNGTIGYVNGKYIEETSINNTPDTVVEGEVYEATAAINIRKTASWAGAIIKVLNKGDFVNVISISNDWAKVYTDGQYAYAPVVYLKKVEESKPQTTTYVTTQDINLRETNSWNGNIVHVLKKGEKIEVIEKSSDWAKVYYMNTVLYAPSKYIELEEEIVTPEAPISPETTDYIAKIDINMRETNTWSGNILKVIKAGETVKVISIEGEWAEIYDDGIIGYVPSQYIENKEGINPEEPTTPEIPITPETVEYIVTGNVNMRTTNSWSGDIVKVIKTGEVVNVVEIEGEWAEIYDDGIYGYIPSKYIINEGELLPDSSEEETTPEAPVVPETVEYVVTEAVNMRETNSWSGNKIKTINAGATVKVISIEGEWAEIYDDGIIGYVPNKYIIKKEAPKEETGEQIKYTVYPYTLNGYVEVQRQKAPSYTSSKLLSYIKPELTHRYESLELNKFREINVAKLNKLLSQKNAGILKNQGQAIYNAAKKHNIDPVYFVSQSIHETGHGKSTLAKGVTITEIADENSPIKDSNGNITGYKMIPLDKPTTVYNLYGIGAKDNIPTMPNRALVLGTTHAYKQGWTSVEKAIDGAANFVSSNYINNIVYKQNTLYKIRYNPSEKYLWHQYATSPWYARDIAKVMDSYDSIYEKNVVFTYDKPKFTDSKEIQKEITEVISTKEESDNDFLTRIGVPDITKEKPWEK